ncbi:MAG TPA: hypothetical protein VIC81_05325 [Acidimicrobiales bacterium]
MRELGIAQRTPLLVQPDASRVVARLFVPGQDLLGGSESRTQSTVARVMDLTDEQVDAALESLYQRFTTRHADIRASFQVNYERVADYVRGPLRPARQQLLGATFTNELSLEGSAICNPSLVASAHQGGLAPGQRRVTMSYRAISEGHRSCIVFREGVISVGGALALEPPAPFPLLGEVQPAPMQRDHVRALLRDGHADGDTAEAVLATLANTFSGTELNEALVRLETQRDTRPNASATARVMRSLAAGFYHSTFPIESALGQRVLWPSAPHEQHGMEDARFVRLVEGEGSRYVATYTAYDGVVVAQQLLETDDFLTFTSSPLAGLASRNKGLAIFPRRVDGHYVALSRHDRESNAVAVTDDLHRWDEAVTLVSPQQDWEMLQLGNCGAPLELPEGWLVLTHGVGPMRTYGIGALLLDLHDPTKILARLGRPLLLPNDEEQNGYVPNVVYSCGAMIHDDTLCLPYGVGDQSIRYATVALEALRAALDDV